MISTTTVSSAGYPVLANGSIGRLSVFEILTQARINIRRFANANCERVKRVCQLQKRANLATIARPRIRSLMDEAAQRLTGGNKMKLSL